MDYLYVCNTASDFVSRVNLGKFSEESRIKLSKACKVGPHGICCWKSDLITANTYSNGITKIDMVQGVETGSYYIGKHCNDVEVYRDEAYITCGESNNIVVFDLSNNKVVEEIPCGNLPHSIDISREYEIIAAANMESDSITVIDYSNKENRKEIKVGPYPTKLFFTQDGKYIFVCESNLGSDKKGSVSIVSLEGLAVTARIQVGKSPVDMCCDERICYVSNFGEGSVSMIYLKDMEQVKKVSVGVMPRGIVSCGRYLYIGDNFGNVLIRYDIFNDRKKTIPIGGEPTGMIII